MGTMLISYPRSGNTWIRYCIEELTNKPTAGYRGKDMFEPKLPLPPIVVKSHLLNKQKLPPNTNALILLYRNPLYVIARHLGNDAFSEFEAGIGLYMHIIEEYHQFQGKKINLQYEFIIENPREALNKITGVLGIGEENIDGFLANLDYHQKECVKKYNSRYGKSLTSKTGFISDKINYPTEGSNLLKQKYPKLSKIYLSNYLI